MSVEEVEQVQRVVEMIAAFGGSSLDVQKAGEVTDA